MSDVRSEVRAGGGVLPTPSSSSSHSKSSGAAAAAALPVASQPQPHTPPVVISEEEEEEQMMEPPPPLGRQREPAIERVSPPPPPPAPPPPGPPPPQPQRQQPAAGQMQRPQLTTPTSTSSSSSSFPPPPDPPPSAAADPPPRPSSPPPSHLLNELVGMKTSDVTNSLIHLYRGELSRQIAYRVRLDTSTNWAVISTSALVVFSLGNPQIPHYFHCVIVVFLCIFLSLEARRYGYYIAVKARVRQMEVGFFGRVLLGSDFGRAVVGLIPIPHPYEHIMDRVRGVPLLQHMDLQRENQQAPQFLSPYVQQRKMKDKREEEEQEREDREQEGRSYQQAFNSPPPPAPLASSLPPHVLHLSSSSLPSKPHLHRDRHKATHSSRHPLGGSFPPPATSLEEVEVLEAQILELQTSAAEVASDVTSPCGVTMHPPRALEKHLPLRPIIHPYENDWTHLLYHSLLYPSVSIQWTSALLIRLHRVYMGLLLGVLVSWVIKVHLTVGLHHEILPVVIVCGLYVLAILLVWKFLPRKESKMMKERHVAAVFVHDRKKKHNKRRNGVHKRMNGTNGGGATPTETEAEGEDGFSSRSRDNSRLPRSSHATTASTSRSASVPASPHWSQQALSERDLLTLRKQLLRCNMAETDV